MMVAAMLCCGCGGSAVEKQVQEDIVPVGPDKSTEHEIWDKAVRDTMPEPVTVSFDGEYGCFLIEFKINGRTVRGLIDTGATFTALSPVTVETLEAEGVLGRSCGTTRHRPRRRGRVPQVEGGHHCGGRDGARYPVRGGSNGEQPAWVEFSCTDGLHRDGLQEQDINAIS